MLYWWQVSGSTPSLNFRLNPPTNDEHTARLQGPQAAIFNPSV